MLLSIFRKLGFREVQSTSVTLQLANGSLTYSNDIFEDVLVKLDKFIFPTNFIVITMEEDKEILLILGRSLLAIERTMIDV